MRKSVMCAMIEIFGLSYVNVNLDTAPPSILARIATSKAAPPHHLSLISRSRNIPTASRPIDMNILALGVLLTRMLRLDLERMRTEVIALSLEEIGREILGAVAVEPRERGAESWCGNAKECSFGNDVAPTGLGFVDGLVEEVVEEEVLECRVVAVRRGDVFEEDGPDDASSTPHQCD